MMISVFERVENAGYFVSFSTMFSKGSFIKIVTSQNCVISAKLIKNFYSFIYQNVGKKPAQYSGSQNQLVDKM